MVSPAPCLRDNVVNLEYLEWEVHPATCTSALLLPKKDVLILPVVDGCIYVSAFWYICPGRYKAVVEEAPHRPLQPHVDQLRRFRRKVYP